MRAKEKNNVKKVLAILLSVMMIFTAVSFNSSGAFAASGVTFEDVELMMIYNPLRYQKEPTEDNAVTASVSTGDMSDTIVPASEYEGAFGMQPAPYGYMKSNLLSERLKIYDLPRKQITSLGSKTGTVKYALQRQSLTRPTVSEKRNFYVDIGVQSEFECLAVGTTTVVWIEVGDPNYTSVKNMAANLVSEMDSKVVANDHNYFGMGRFYDPANNNLINALCHDLNSSGAMGYFFSADLYSAEEAVGYKVNTDMPIVHVNSSAAEGFGVSSICSTLAHEYQHLIAATESLTNTQNSYDFMEAWIDETMAMEAIELSYPGDCVGSYYLYVYNSAKKHREGQSLYNFDTDKDIGAYGQAFLFGQYLEKYLGVEKFKEFHDYWRTNANQTEGKGLSAVAPSSNKTEVESTITYPADLKTTLGADEFMSKLALCYNVAVIKQDTSGKYGISYSKGGYTDPTITKINPLLYKGTNANIEGGGRILVKPKDGKYIVPDDADPNLIYVGFSKDGKTITLDPTFAVAQHKVTYEDLEAGTEKPATASTLPAEKKYAEGATVTVEPNLTTTETTYNGKEGTWTFDGWNVKTPKGLTITGTNPKTFTMPGEDVVLVPKWTFTEKAEKFTVKYDWGTVPADVAAPSELPVDNKEYDTAEAAEAAMDTTFTNKTTRPGTQGGKTGNWTFSGWTPSVEGQVVTFTGSWTFKADNPSVTNVTVTPATATVDAGDSQAFTAKVTGVNLTDNTVTWTVEGAKSADTKIDASGNLVVGEDETATTLTVRATSKQDSTKSGTATVTVTKPEPPKPTVTKVTVTPATAEMEVGTNKTFTATVTGKNSPNTEVTWTVEGAKSADTKIDADGKLVVGEDETAATLTVRATSVQDTTKSGTATVTVTQNEDPGEDPQPTPVDRIPVDNTGDGKADVYVEVETRNEDGTCIGVDGNKYFDPDGDGIYVKWLAPVLLDPPVKKVVTGKDAFNTKGHFAFTMMGAAGAPMPTEIPGKTSYDKDGNKLTATLDGEGRIEFGDIAYTVDLVPNNGDSKTFTYYLREINTGNESYTYDTTSYTMTVTITNNGNELVKTVKYATAAGKVVDEITFTNIYKSPAVKPIDPAKPGTPGGKPSTLVPNTGDTMNTALYEALLLAGLGIAVAILSRKKEEKE